MAMCNWPHAIWRFYRSRIICSTQPTTVPWHSLAVCVCVDHLKRCKTSKRWFGCFVSTDSFFQSWTGFSNSAGGLGCPCKYQPNEEACMRHWYHWRRPVTYLPIVRNGKRLNPRTSMASQLKLTVFCTVVAIWIYFGHLRMVQLHQNCLQSKGVESILLTEFHAGSTNFSCQVLLNCLCTWDAFHNRNSQWCFWASVSFLLCTSSWQEPFGESLSRLTIDSKTMSEFTLLN